MLGCYVYPCLWKSTSYRLPVVKTVWIRLVQFVSFGVHLACSLIESLGFVSFSIPLSLFFQVNALCEFRPVGQSAFCEWSTWRWITQLCPIPSMNSSKVEGSTCFLAAFFSFVGFGIFGLPMANGREEWVSMGRSRTCHRENLHTVVTAASHKRSHSVTDTDHTHSQLYFERI